MQRVAEGDGMRGFESLFVTGTRALNLPCLALEDEGDVETKQLIHEENSGCRRWPLSERKAGGGNA